MCTKRSFLHLTAWVKDNIARDDKVNQQSNAMKGRHEGKRPSRKFNVEEAERVSERVSVILYSVSGA